ncbi:MAG: chemotaxis protein MotB [Desulfuromonas sp.]|uniref:OmpA/MotB family protein n=1 Tax=Desulfuromonas sp. TaxID=892 RepID=UPI000CAB8B17|nr:OmpA family protein [Desulfuromonas sp.]PLX84620.1 MAG: chemotaxis protein MotB [Desulfuromonas sp.]
MRSTWILALIALITLTSPGCVKKSTYLQKVDEAALLGNRFEDLQSRHSQLQQQRDELAARNDDLDRRLAESLAKGTALEQDLERARNDIGRLEKVLSDRSAEAGAAMAEMRRTTDRLEEENRGLHQQVEKERLAREARLAQMKSTYDELVDKMESEIERGEITISELQGKLTVNLVERILFDSGKADIKPEGLNVLRRVGDILGGVKDKAIRVEGHTDDVPISPRLQTTFPTNWELSTARAANVVHFLQDRVNIPGERLSAAGFSEYRPVADNGSPEGRAQNRRIQIVLVPSDAETIQPLQ